MLWEQDVAGSNPVTPTTAQARLQRAAGLARDHGVVTTIFAFVIGLVLGLAGMGFMPALLALVAALAAKLFVDLRWDKDPLFRRPSPYLIYCYNLERSGEPTSHAWISYGLQLLVFGIALGIAAYAAGRYMS